MRRREFIAGLGSAAAWPVISRAQQPAMPTIGWLGETTGWNSNGVSAFRQGLSAAGFVEGRNVAFEFRFADNQPDRLLGLANELVHQRVAVIATPSTAAALTAKAATKTTPIVFAVGSDPVALGLVTSLNRPGGNATGINFFINELVGKRLELLRSLVPGASRVAVLVNPANVALAETATRDVERAAHAMGVQIKLLNATTSDEIHAAFERLSREPADALFVSTDPFFTLRRVQVVTLAARHGLPTSFTTRDPVEVGGLMSYGTNLNDAFHQIGDYAGRILKGEKPGDLPVVQTAKFELVINLVTARMLGLIVPPWLLATADEVIE